MKGYDARALAEEFRALVRQIGFGGGKPLVLAAHDMGAPPALLWAADHPEEVAGLLYVEAPVMLSAVLTKVIAYTPEAMTGGFDVVVDPAARPRRAGAAGGRERACLSHVVLRQGNRTPGRHHVSGCGRGPTNLCRPEGVLGAMGVYRAAFTSIEQTDPLAGGLLRGHKVKVPVVALGGEKGLGAKVLEMVKLVAEDVEGGVVADCGHFVPEERPDVIVSHLRALREKTAKP